MATQQPREPLHRRVVRRPGWRLARPVGFVLVMVAASLTALMGFAALGIDLAYIMEGQTELAAVADATALASASGLTVSVDENTKQAEARTRAETYAALNKVLGQSLNLNSQSAPLEFGRWDTGTRTFQEGVAPSDAVHVSLELTDTSSPSAPTLFFAPVLGHTVGRIAASATAALVGSRDIVLALDRSGSMDDDGLSPPQPITDTKEAAKDFVDLLDPEGDQVGLVSYSDSASLDEQLTDNFTSVQSAIDGLSANGCTNIAAALCKARREATSSNANSGAVPVIVLLSDGKANTRVNPSTCEISGSGCGSTSGGESDARNQADEIKLAGIVLYTISLGNATNTRLMEDMARPTGGEHFHAPSAADLEDIFVEISQRIQAVLVE